mgnify:CR=1 FL=1
MFKEFKEFAMRGNVTDKAVGIVIGAGRFTGWSWRFLAEVPGQAAVA